ncbi:MAG: ABC transporter substrate-binding protein [Candidatus Hodarchaeota archaeon]
MNRQQMISLVLVVILSLSLILFSIPPVLTQARDYLFSIKLVASSNDPVQVQAAQLIANQLEKVSAGGRLFYGPFYTDVILVGRDVLISRILGSKTHADYAGGGFDMGFLNWTDSIVPRLFDYFHSSNIDPASYAANYYPVDNKTVDNLLEFVMNTTVFNQRKDYIRKVLKSIVWDIHPVLSLYQPEKPFYMCDDIRGFDVQRFPNIEEIYFENRNPPDRDRLNELIIASNGELQGFNPVISNSWYDRLVWKSLFRSLIERDENLMFVPELAAQLPYPIAVRNNYTGEVSSTDPNTATVWELKLREDIYWHEGYGYRISNAIHREILKFDADDVVWYYKISLKDDSSPNPSRSLLQQVFGKEPEKAIVKKDKFCVQFHLKSLYGDLFTLFDFILPQHILDPTYNALGLGEGVRADGSSAPNYDSWEIDDFNLGKRFSGDWEYPATIGNGAYILYPGKNSIQQTVTLTKWNHYFKDNDNYWRPRVENRIEKCIYKWIRNKDAAKLALGNREIDIMDVQYTAERDYPMKNKPGIMVAKRLEWGYQTIGYNILNGAGGKLANRYVRLAISHMIPRQDIVDYLLGGLGKVTFAPFPLQSPFYPKDLDPISFNLTVAEEYLEKAGYDWRFYYIEENSSPPWLGYFYVMMMALPLLGLFFVVFIGILAKLASFDKKKDQIQ